MGAKVFNNDMTNRTAKPEGHPNATPATDARTGQWIGWYHLDVTPAGQLVRRWVVQYPVI